MACSTTIRSAVFGGATALTISCAIACTPPTAVQREWSNPSEFVGPMKSVVVLVQNASPDARHRIEDRFAAELSQRGTNAQPSYAALGNANMTAEEAGGALRARGYEGMLVVRLAPPEKELTSWRNEVPHGMYSENDYSMDVHQRSDAALWDLRDKNRVWSATLETTNPGTSDLYSRALVNKVMPALEKQGMVSPK
jgi:hypothetical protein